MIKAQRDPSVPSRDTVQEEKPWTVKTAEIYAAEIVVPHAEDLPAVAHASRDDYDSPSESDSGYENDRRNHRHRSHRDKDYGRPAVHNGSRATFEGVKRLKPDEVGYFDASDKTSTVAYCKRLNFLAHAYGEPSVCVVVSSDS